MNDKVGRDFTIYCVPIILTVSVWPQTAAPGNEYGTGTWFNWVKTYSALAGITGFMAIRYIPFKKFLLRMFSLHFHPFFSKF